MNNKLFYIIASGPSYMDITEEEWKYLENKHTITFTRVPYGGRRTEYYLSIEGFYVDKEVLEYMAKLGYLDTNLLLYIPESLKLAKELGFKKIRQIVKGNFYFMPSMKPWFTNESNPPHTFLETRAKSFRQPLFRFRGQLTAVINACIILGASEIRLISVDLNSQKSFYQYPELLNKVCEDKGVIERYIDYNNKRHDIEMNDVVKEYSKFDLNTMHSTNTPLYESKWEGKSIRGIADVLEWINKEMKSEGMDGLYICNKESLLYKQNKLEYRGILDESC